MGGALSGTAAEDEVPQLRMDIADTRHQIIALEETLPIGTVERISTTDRFKIEIKDLNRKQLEKLSADLAADYDRLRRLEFQKIGRSTMKKPTLTKPIVRAVTSLVPSDVSGEERAALDDPDVMIGNESDYGLRWDRKWEGNQAGPTDEACRKNVREGTKSKVVKELGLKYFGQSASQARRLPPLVDATHLFLDGSLRGTNSESLGAAAGGVNLLGRFDVVCVKVCSDYTDAWKFVKSSRHDFWVSHAAALNIGESTRTAADFPDFSRSNNNSPSLNEEAYFEAMTTILRNVVYAASQLDVEHLVFFPFGMGAFLRHLEKLDKKYEDQIQMQRLRRRLARCYAEVFEKSPAKLAIHICLQFGQDEANRNADAFLRGLADPALKRVRSRVTVWPDADCMQLAHDLAARNEGVLLVNGGNRQLLGNHWFVGRAKMAIDENLHRRSWRLAALSYMLNNFDGEPEGRQPDQLRKTVELFRGKVIDDCRVKARSALK
jgi:hypothetical protein